MTTDKSSNSTTETKSATTKKAAVKRVSKATADQRLEAQETAVDVENASKKNEGEVVRPFSSKRVWPD